RRGVGGPHTDRGYGLVLRTASSPLYTSGCVENDLLSPTFGPLRHRGMVQGQRAKTLPRATRRGFARGVLGALYGRRDACLSGAIQRFRAAAVPEVLHGGNSLEPRLFFAAPTRQSRRRRSRAREEGQNRARN